MSKSDYVCCDVCDCKCIYDGDWKIRNADTGDRAQEAMKGGKLYYSCLCGDCYAKQQEFEQKAAQGEETLK